MNTFIRALLLLFSMLTAGAANAAPRAVILEGVALPPHMDAFHAQIRSAVENSAVQAGRDVVPSAGMIWCASPECLLDVAKTSRADEVIVVAGRRNDAEGWALTLELRAPDGSILASRAGGCEICTGPALVRAAGVAASSLLARSRPEPPAPLAPASPVLPKTSSDTAVAPIVGEIAMTGLGAGLLGAGVYLALQNGQETDCKGAGFCVSEKHTLTRAIPMMGIGAASCALGAFLLWREFHKDAKVGLAVSPSSIGLVGRFE